MLLTSPPGSDHIQDEVSLNEELGLKSLSNIYLNIGNILIY